MKNLLSIKTTSLALALCFYFLNNITSCPVDSFSFDNILIDFNVEINHEKSIFLSKRHILNIELEAINVTLINTAGKKNRKFQNALIQKIELMEDINLLETQWDITLIGVRYRKGIELIRLMYEKILGLDHHFTGLHTYQHISVLSNPHSYPTFQKTKELLEKNKNEKYNMGLPSLLQSNPFISATYTMVSVLLGENSSKEKEKEMEDIACILDFTVRMNADLNVIKNETEYLKISNQALKKDCERLFQEYTKPVNYLVQLAETRTNDDWESLSDKLADLMVEMEEEIKTSGNISVHTSRKLVNLEFATQRVIDFITKYSNFIGQGTQYYQKFDNIVSSYQGESLCHQQLPRQFSEMREDIKSTIEKFENTYDLPELQGSRLKNLMFGVGE